MNPVKILVVEDQLVTAKRMKLVLENKGYEITAIATSSKEALNAVNGDVPDVVIMDIRLKGPTDGITTARAINTEYSIPIIYVTQLDDDSVFRIAKDTHPKNFITKPFTDSTLVRAVELAIQQQSITATCSPENRIPAQVSDAIFVLTKDKKHRKLFFKDILYMQSSGAYTKIYVEGHDLIKGDYINVAVSSNHVIRQLGCESIVQVHRSYYVNVNRIDGVSDTRLFIQHHSVPISRKYKKAIYDKLLFLRQNSALN